MEIRGIKYVAPMFDNSGYAQASRGNILALHKRGVPLTLSPISFEKTHPDLGEDGEILKSLVNKDIDYNIIITHTTPEFWANYQEAGKTNVGYTIWETSKLHPDWVPHINNNAEKVLVGCTWNVEVFKSSGIKVPIGVVPHGINADKFDGVEPFNVAGVGKDTYMFYSIFQWFERKNPIDLLRTYWSTFRDNEDVALVLKTYRMGYSDEEKNAVRNIIKQVKSTIKMDNYPKVYLIPNMLSEQEMLGLHKRGNCYVSLDHGEGFGLCPFAAGAAGNPIIITGYGGALEFATYENSYLVNYTLEPVHSMPYSPWYKGDQWWAKPDLYKASALMYSAYRAKQSAKDKGAKLQEHIKENFSWDRIADKIVKELEAI